MADFSSIQDIDGLQFIPVNEHKIPTVKDWQTTKTKHDLSNTYGVGLVCGEPSGGIEVIDIDAKYSLDGNLLSDYKALINEKDKSLLKKIVVQKTKNNGYHFIYRCAEVGGNTKLANRPTTQEEKQFTYDKTYNAEILKGIDDAAAKKVAEKSKNNDKVRVLIETRGVGGQIVCHPTPGYEMIHLDILSVNEITVFEKNILFQSAKELNEVFEEVAPTRAVQTQLAKIEGLSPFEDYNRRGDCVSLLVMNGWKVTSNKGAKTFLLRPGDTKTKSSGNYDSDRQWFTVFTTSTEFENEKAYQPYAVYAYLECNKDFQLASSKLYDLGYGDRRQEKVKPQSTREIKSRITLEDDDLSFLATPEDGKDYLKQVRDGTLPMGLTTGCPSLDEYFLLKEGNLVMINGHDNVGKTKWILWLLMVASLYHGWKGILFASENSLGSLKRTLIEFYWGKSLSGIYQMTLADEEKAQNFINNHFQFIKANEDLYNYKDIINMVKKIRAKHNGYNYALVDPYNSLKIDLSGFSKLSTHEYHYEALSEIKAYGQQTKFGHFINNHAVTAALRLKDGEKKYPVAPQKADTEGGGKFGNKADDFITLHRITQHPTDWKYTEVHIRKIKETETGGRPTAFDIPVRFELIKNGTAFVEVLEGNIHGVNPILEWHRKTGSVQEIDFKTFVNPFTGLEEEEPKAPF